MMNKTIKRHIQQQALINLVLSIGLVWHDIQQTPCLCKR